MNPNTPNNQVTLNQIIDVLQNDIAGKHKNIKSFYCGEIANFRLLTTTYPLLYVHYSNASLKLHEIEYDLNLFVLDRLETDFSNENNIYSDTLQTLTDIKSLLKYGKQYYNLFRVDDNTPVVKVTDKINSDLVCGWNMNIKIRTDFVYNICTIPLT